MGLFQLQIPNTHIRAFLYWSRPPPPPVGLWLFWGPIFTLEDPFNIKWVHLFSDTEHTHPGIFISESPPSPPRGVVALLGPHFHLRGSLQYKMGMFHNSSCHSKWVRFHVPNTHIRAFLYWSQPSPPRPRNCGSPGALFSPQRITSI